MVKWFKHKEDILYKFPKMQELGELDAGFYAQQILDNPLMQNLFESFRADLYTQWKSSPILAKGEREEIYIYLKLLDKFENYIHQQISNAAYVRHNTPNGIPSEDEGVAVGGTDEEA